MPSMKEDEENQSSTQRYARSRLAFELLNMRWIDSYTIPSTTGRVTLLVSDGFPHRADLSFLVHLFDELSRSRLTKRCG